MSAATGVTELVLSRGGAALAARLHRPAGSGSARLPTVVCMGSWLTVKEQMADLYAGRLARAGPGWRL